MRLIQTTTIREQATPTLLPENWALSWLRRVRILPVFDGVITKFLGCVILLAIAGCIVVAITIAQFDRELPDYQQLAHYQPL